LTSGRVRIRRFRLPNWWWDYRWFLWAGGVCLIFILGYIGFRHHFDGRGHHSLADYVYLSVQLFPLQSGAVAEPVPWELQVARIVAPALAAVGIVGAATEVYRALRQQRWKLRRLRDHIVICGCGRRGSLLAVALMNGNRPTGKVIIIENGADPEVAHPELASHWSLTPWEDDLTGPEFDRGDYLADVEPESVAAIYVCFDDEHLALTTTLRLKQHFPGTPIKVRMTQRNGGLATLLPENVSPFGLMEEACTPGVLGLE
jgi:hypothetical protein